MKVFMINPNNERIEAEVIRYFQNINDKYIIYTLGEKDANGFQIVYATKIVNEGGVRVGKTITDENEWALLKNFIKETVNQNKNGEPLTIQDANPAEIMELKIDSMRPFKLQPTVVEMFEKNQKNFEIVQNVAPVEGVTPVEEEQTVLPPVEPVAEPAIAPTVEAPALENALEPSVEAPVESPVEQPVVPTEVPAEPLPEASAPVESAVQVPTPENIAPVTTEAPNTGDYQAMYEAEVAKNKDLANELEKLMNDYVSLKTKVDQIKELLG